MNREPQIQVFRIAHSDGSYIEVSNLGARWLSWVVPDGNGKYSDILLGYPTVLDYLQDDCYMGAIVGRFANRIAGATFSLEGHEYTLEKNDGANTIQVSILKFGKEVMRETKLYFVCLLLI